VPASGSIARAARSRSSIARNRQLSTLSNRIVTLYSVEQDSHTRATARSAYSFPARVMGVLGFGSLVSASWSYSEASPSN
jgi:hypothetical protein